MSKTKTGKKVLSLLLTLCMALSLMPAMGITASAANGLVGTALTIDSTDPAAGTGWKWDGSTLTLSGVSLTQLEIKVPATIVLEGANKITATTGKAIDASSSTCTLLTIEGSGTLEVSGSSDQAMHAMNLTINSGYIKATNTGNYTGIKVCNSFIVNGGYVEASSTGSSGIETTSFTQTGGYVKAVGQGGDGLRSESTVTVSGGYLEAEATAADKSAVYGETGFTNSDGVVKATAKEAGKYGISGGASFTASFTGGVTIAKGETKAISGAIAGLSAGGEKLYDNTGTKVASSGNVVTSSDLTSVVIAKSATSTYSTETELNGAYICVNYSDTSFPYHFAWEPNGSASVTGGSYLENLGNSGVILAPGIGTKNETTVSGTLVAETSKNGIVIKTTTAKVTVESTGTLFVHNKSNGANGSQIDNFTNNGGNLIVEAGKGSALYASSLTQTGGYTCGISNTNNGIIVKTSFAVSGGYVAALQNNIDSTTNAALNANNCTPFSVSGAGVVSAVSKSVNGFKITSGTVPSVTATGAASKFDALTFASFDATDKTFKVSGTTAPVVCLKAPPPPPDGTFEDSFGTTIANTAVLSYVSGETVHPTKGYTFAGWYDNAAYTGTAVTSEFADGTTYYAKWTKGGKTVVTTPLDCTGSVTLPADSGITWNSGANTLTLDGATIDCSGNINCQAAITLPDGVTIMLVGANTVKAGEVTVPGGAYKQSNGIFVKGGTATGVTILGNGSLDLSANRVTDGTCYIFGINGENVTDIITVTVGNAANSPTVNVTVYPADLSYALCCNANVQNGNVTLCGADGAIYSDAGCTLTATGATIKTNTAAEAGIGAYEAANLANYKWLNVAFTSAALSSVAVEGTMGTALSGAPTATVTLTGDTFKDVAVGTEFPTNVAGLKATVTAVNDTKTVATVTFSDTPTVIKNDKLTVTIPGENLTKGAAITSAVNNAATVKIATNTVYQRTDPLDLRVATATVEHKDKYNTVQSTATPAADITDSGEGWAWYPNGVNGIDGKNYTGKVLVLSGANIQTNSPHALNLPAGTTIVLKAGTTSTVKSTFTGTPADSTEGVVCAGALTIEGSGTLNATGGTATGDNDSVGIIGDGLTINGGVVNGTGGNSARSSAGISGGSGVLTINGGTVKGQGGAGAAASVGLYATGGIAVNGGSATGNGNTAAFATEANITFPATMAINTPNGGVVKVYNSFETIYAIATATAPATTATIGAKPAPPSGGGGAPTPTTTKVPVVVDGQEYNIGTAETTGDVTTVTVDQTELQKQLDSARETVVVPVTPGANADTVVAQFVVANVNEMAEKEMTLSVQVDDVSYDMRAVAVDTSALMEELGASDPEEVPVNVTIRSLTIADVTLENGELVLPPVQFTVTASYGGRSVEVEVFQKYVQRVIEVPANVDASKITTAVVVENGKQRHVPTEVFQKDGKWYARINSLTNSAYALIWNEQSFTDAQGKWFADIVTEMASRGVINGKGEGVFDGEANITRAEFAAVLVRALGLPENGDASVFTDVAKEAWYYGAVGKAYEYGLIEGRGAGLFAPGANITRQEAMAMVRRAAAIAEYAGTTGTLEGFRDARSVSDWALEDAKWNVGSGLISGNSKGEISGQANITRAESATIVLRLLQQSGLVDVRVEA